MYIGVVLIGMLAVITGFIHNYFSPNGIAIVGDWDSSKGVITAKPKNDPVLHDRELTDILYVKSLFDQKECLFVDSRDADSYQQGHIEGAVSLPVNTYIETIEEFLTTYPLTTCIVTYCSGRQCDDSHILAQHLVTEGYTKVSVFIDGYPAWEENGFPVERN